MSEWFNKIKNKLQFFSLGLMAGLIAGGGFFIFKLDDYFKELRAYKNAIGEQQVKEKDRSKEEEKADKTKKIKTYPKKSYGQNSGILYSDSLEASNTELITENKSIDTTSISLTKDSLTTSAAATTNNENVIVRKDELVDSKIMEVQNFNLVSDNTRKDSVLQKISGIKEETPKSSYKVEIWTSPLNYKGYKMTKSKIILYGITNYETIKLYQMADDVFIRTPSNTYKLEYSSEFKQLEKITDESVLAKLK